MEKDFTVNDAISIQQDQLREWKKVLIPEVYGDLRNYAEETNRTEKKPNSIRRGNDLSTYVTNYAIQFKPIDNNMPMTKMTADDLRRLRHGDTVFYGNGSTLRSLRYVGRMPSGEAHYLIFSDGEFLKHLYLGRDGSFHDDWFMGAYDNEFVGNYIIENYQKKIESIRKIYLEKD